MLHLRSFNRFILISLALLGLSISSQAHSVTVTYFGTADGSPTTPFFDPAIGTLEIVIVDYTVDVPILITGSYSGVTDLVPFGADGMGTSHLFGPVAIGPDMGFFLEEGVGLGPSGSFGIVADYFGSGSDFFFSFEVLPFIGLGAYGFLVDAFLDPCTNLYPGTSVISSCDFIAPPFGSYSVTYEYFPSPSAVPVPAAIWLFGTALLGFVGMSRRRKVA
jgi:hypothetical protein